MGSIGIWQIVLVVLLAVLLFGRGKISDLMGDVAKGIRSFKRGLSEEDTSVADVQAIENQNDQTITMPKTASTKTGRNKPTS